MGTDVTVSVGRDADRRAILLGAIAGAAVVLFPYVTGTTLHVALLAPFVSGGVAGWTSRSFEHELNDGVSAAVLALLLTLVGLAVLIWFGNPRLPVDVRIDLILFMLIFGVFIAIGASVFAGIIGGVVAWMTASLRRRLRFHLDRE